MDNRTAYIYLLPTHTGDTLSASLYVGDDLVTPVATYVDSDFGPLVENIRQLEYQIEPVVDNYIQQYTLIVYANESTEVGRITLYAPIELDITADNPAIPVPTVDARSVTAFIYTEPNTEVSALWLANNSNTLTVSPALQTTTADANGLATFTMVKGAVYRYWIGDGDYKTVEIEANTPDPYSLE